MATSALRKLIWFLLIPLSLCGQVKLNSVRCPISKAGLLGYWRFDEGIGTKTADWSNNGYHSLYHSPQSWTNAIFNSGCYYNGTSSNYTSFGDVCDVGTSDFAVSFWIKFHTLDNSETLIGKYGSNGSTTVGWYLGKNASNYLYGKVRDETTNTVVTSTQVFSSYTWYHVVLNVDRSDGSNGLHFYVNNVAKGTGTQGSGNIDNNERLMIANLLDTWYGEIEIDECYIFKRLLTTDEISALYYFGLKKITEDLSSSIRINAIQ